MRILKLLFIFSLIASPCSAAIDANMVGEIRNGGHVHNGGGFVWLDLTDAGTYRWTESGTEAGEYWCELAAGGDPSLADPGSVTTDGTFNLDTEGAVGGLNAGEWDYAQNDAQGYSTVYVRLDDTTDPDTKGSRFVLKGIDVGIDYSQQDAAELTVTDGACVIASTTVTSATNSFTGAMVGSIMGVQNTGEAAIDGIYQILVVNDTDSLEVDRTICSGGSNAEGATLRIGGGRAIASNTEGYFENLEDGNKIWVETGTHTLTAGISIDNDGTIASPIVVEGYKTLRGDNPKGTDRPLIAAGANICFFDNYWSFYNVRGTSTHNNGAPDLDLGATFVNCDFNNTSGTAGRYGTLSGHSGTTKWKCEFQSVNGYGTQIYAYQNVSFCNFHDSNIGGQIHNVYNTISDCVFDTMSSYGLQFTHNNTATTWIMNNTFYDADGGSESAIYSAVGSENIHIVNNIFDNWDKGVNFTTFFKSTYLDNNVWDCTTDVTNVTKGPNAVTGDPGLTDPGNGDFTIGSGSNALDAGMQIGTDEGVTGKYPMNSGVDQDDNVTGNGGGASIGWVSIDN